MAGAVFRGRGPRLACFGYFGHMWELYPMWAWLGVFLAASLEARGGGSYLGLNAPAATFVAMGLGGALGAYAGGALADRWGRTTLTMAAMALSGLCAAMIGLSFGGPPALTFALAVFWGITVVADSAQFSTAVTELSPPAYVGTALTAQTCVGFALTMVSIWLIPPVVRMVGWSWAFAMLAPGPALGVLAMARLRASPESRKNGGRPPLAGRRGHCFGVGRTLNVQRVRLACGRRRRLAPGPSHLPAPSGLPRWPERASMKSRCALPRCRAISSSPSSATRATCSAHVGGRPRSLRSRARHGCRARSQHPQGREGADRAARRRFGRRRPRFGSCRRTSSASLDAIDGLIRACQLMEAEGTTFTARGMREVNALFERAVELSSARATSR